MQNQKREELTLPLVAFLHPSLFQTTQPWNKAKYKQNIGNAKPQCLARSQERQSSQLESSRGAKQLRAGEAIPRQVASAWLTVLVLSCMYLNLNHICQIFRSDA